MSEAEFNELYNVHYATAFFFARKLAGEVFADDILMHAFVSVWKNREKINTLSSGKNWLFTAIKYASLNFKRDSAKWRYAPITPYLEQILPAEEICEAIKEEVICKIYEEIENCHPKDRAILILYFRGWNVEKIAEKLRIAYKTVYTRKDRALKRLKINLYDKINAGVISI